MPLRTQIIETDFFLNSILQGLFISQTPSWFQTTLDNKFSIPEFDFTVGSLNEMLNGVSSDFNPSDLVRFDFMTL